MVERAGLDQGQRPFYGALGSLPGRTERRGLGPAAQAGAIAGAFGRCSAPVEQDVTRQRRPHPTDRPAIDAGRSDRDEDAAVEGRIATTKGLVESCRVLHDMQCTPIGRRL